VLVLLACSLGRGANPDLWAARITPGRLGARARDPFPLTLRAGRLTSQPAPCKYEECSFPMAGQCECSRADAPDENFSLMMLAFRIARRA